MSVLDDIVRHGNRSPHHYRENNRIVCKDGFSLSVIAGGGTYCTPRAALPGLENLPHMYDVGADYPGPYSRVEVGFPSERPEPWRCTDWNEGWDRHTDHATCDGWAVLADGIGDTDDWETVYGYVPVEMVRALIASHGGEA